MTPDGAKLEELWRAAKASPVVTAFRTAEVDVCTPQGAVLVAVDRDDRKHLLVPLDARHTLKQDVDGQAVLVRRRALEDENSYRSYASLELIDARLSDLFTALSVEVVERIAEKPASAVAALRSVLADWRALLSGARESLSPSKLAGLFAELHVLNKMLMLDAGAVSLWTGPSGAAQDFHRGSNAIEVKATTSPEGRTVRIHGIDQLDLAPPGYLLLCWLRLSTDQGKSVPDMVDDILALTDDSAVLRKSLLAAGYREADRDIYARRMFEVAESRAYVVGPGFPRIVADGLSGDAVVAGVGPVEYSIDLDSAAAEAMRIDEDPVDLLLEIS